MQIHQIQPIHKKRKARRIGRGGKKGTYSGRGMKGQTARSGHRMQPRIRELLKKYPKLRGYRRKSMQEKVITVNLGFLERYFGDGETVNPALLAQKKIAGRIKGKPLAIKILATGTITKAIVVEGCRVSQTAKEKIKKAGGQVI